VTDEFRSKLQVRQGAIKPLWQIRRSRTAVTPAPEQMCIIKRKDIRLISLDAMIIFKLRVGVHENENGQKTFYLRVFCSMLLIE
jgi:hypothetical protein